MAGGAAFADILDEKVCGFGESGAMPDPPFEARVVPPHPLLFARPQRPFRASPYRAVARETGPMPQRPAAARPAPPPVRPSRPLTRRQRLALDAFIELGASLRPDFVSSELRSAFRLLALAYHPDRHPGCSDAEKTRLTRLLADLIEHHRHLLTALRPAA
jgi:hypothetical protein